MVPSSILKMSCINHDDIKSSGIEFISENVENTYDVWWYE